MDHSPCLILAPHQNGQVDSVPILLQYVEVTLQHFVTRVEHYAIVELGNARVVAMVHKVIGHAEDTLPIDDELWRVFGHVRRKVDFAIRFGDFLEFAADSVVGGRSLGWWVGLEGGCVGGGVVHELQVPLVAGNVEASETNQET